MISASFQIAFFKSIGKTRSGLLRAGNFAYPRAALPRQALPEKAGKAGKAAKAAYAERCGTSSHDVTSKIGLV